MFDLLKTLGCDSSNMHDFMEKNNLIVKKYASKSGNVYDIVQYDKKYITKDSDLKIFKSLIFEDNKLLSFSPPKSHDFETFKSKYNIENVTCEILVEGTMVNLFWSSKGWEIATRGTVGANISYYKDDPENTTFRYMFLECCNEANFEFDKLDRKYCYSFVMQHTKNKIVGPIPENALYLVAIYEIKQNDNELTIKEHYKDSKEYLDVINNIDDTYLRLPKIYNFDSYEEAKEMFGSFNTPYQYVGLTIKHYKSGERANIYNPAYIEVKKLRGNEPKLQFTYLRLRQENKVRPYLKYYPENKGRFSIYKDQVHNYTKTLYDNYIKCFIKKLKPHTEFPYQYRTHMFLIHNLYLNTLKSDKKIVTIKYVIDYFNKLHPAQQMYVINYNNTKLIKDEI